VRRARPLPLNETAAWALGKLVERALKVCGCSHGDHYLIPYQNKNHSYDPTRPPSLAGWRTALSGLFAIAGVDIRNYDLRHHAVSSGLSNPSVSLPDAQNYFGWVSPKMIRRYYHANVQGLNRVAAAMDKKALQRKIRGGQFSTSEARSRVNAG
jgi:integrase